MAKKRRARKEHWVLVDENDRIITQGKLGPAPRRPRRSRRSNVTLGEPTKKDFEAMAKILCRHNADPDLVNDIARHFGGQNPRFSQDRFVAATRMCKG